MEIEWSDSNSVGVREIDEQHKELVSITNELFQAILDEKGFEVLLNVLKKLENYVEYHFPMKKSFLFSIITPPWNSRSILMSTASSQRG